MCVKIILKKLVEVWKNIYPFTEHVYLIENKYFYVLNRDQFYMIWKYISIYTCIHLRWKHALQQCKIVFDCYSFFHFEIAQQLQCMQKQTFHIMQ